MRKIFELAWGVIRRPAPTFRRIKEEKPWGRGLIIALLPGLLYFYISIFKTTGFFYPQAFLAEFGPPDLIESSIDKLFQTYISAGIYTFLFGLSALILRGKRQTGNLLLSCLFIVGIIGSIGCLIHFVQPLILFRILFYLLKIWLILLLVIAVKEMHELSISRSIATLGLVLSGLILIFVATVPNLFFTYSVVSGLILGGLFFSLGFLVWRKVFPEIVLKKKVVCLIGLLFVLTLLSLRMFVTNSMAIPLRIKFSTCIYPEDVVVDSENNIYVTDFFSIRGRLYKFSPFGKEVSQLEKLSVGIRMVMDDKNIVYSPIWKDEKGGCEVQKFSTQGDLIKTLFLRPRRPIKETHLRDITVDAQSNIFLLVSIGKHPKTIYKLQKFSAQGKLLMEFGEKGEGDEQFYYPRAITTDKEGNIYVSNLYKIQKFNNKGKLLRVFKDPKYGLKAMDIEVDDTGDIYIISSTPEKMSRFSVKKFDENGRILMISEGGEETETEKGFYAPGGLALDKEGNIYITDPWNYRIQVFDSQGKFLRSIRHKPFLVKWWYKKSMPARMLEAVAKPRLAD